MIHFERAYFAAGELAPGPAGRARLADNPTHKGIAHPAIAVECAACPSAAAYYTSQRVRVNVEPDIPTAGSLAPHRLYKAEGGEL